MSITSPPSSALRSLDHAQLQALVNTSQGMLVDSMIQEHTVNIIVGDSGIGKTPLLQQLALAVATGRPFLGLRTRQTRVLCVDYENSATEIAKVLTQLSKFFHITESDLSNYRILISPESKPVIEQEIRSYQPELVIIDALRGLDHKAEKDAESCMACLDWLHKKAEKYQTSFLILHHTRKPDQKDPPPKLAALNQPVLSWLLQASGSRSLINQTEARFAIEELSQGQGNASLLLRGHVKLTGEFGPLFIERIYDEDEPEPLGYTHVSGISLLSQADRERSARLPESFTWAEAEAALGIKRGRALIRLIFSCRAAGIIEKRGSGKNAHYVRVHQEL